MKVVFFLNLALVSLAYSCTIAPAGKTDKQAISSAEKDPQATALRAVSAAGEQDSTADKWYRLDEKDDSLLFAIAYADTGNFTGQQLYDCAACILRPEVAKALKSAQRAAAREGLQLLIFDCYRPTSVQEKLYAALPDRRFVAKPGKGSMHSRGCAVDLSLARGGIPLDMGSAFDDMTEASAYAAPGLKAKERDNRAKLRSVMTAAGFRPYEREWWHFSYAGCNAELSNYKWECR